MGEENRDPGGPPRDGRKATSYGGGNIGSGFQDGKGEESTPAAVAIKTQERRGLKTERGVGGERI